MKNFRFLSKVPKNKSFSFTPRYYNPEKDELEKRVKLAMLEAKQDKEAKIIDEERGRFSIREQHKMADKFNDVSINRSSMQRIQHQKNVANVRFIVILNILLIIVLYIFIKVL